MELADRAHRNMVDAFAKLPAYLDGGVVRRTNGIVTAVTGSPIPLFNGVMPVDAAVRPADLIAEIAAVRELQAPVLVQLRTGVDDGLIGAVESSGLVLDPEVSMPAMALTDLFDDFRSPPELVITEVTDPAAYDAYRATGASFLGVGLYDDPDVSCFVGSVDGRAVCKSLAIRSDGVVGIFNVNTIEAARGRGYGWAMTAVGIASGARRGCDMAALQASSMGLPIYQRHGFHTLFEYRAYVDPPT